MKLKDVLALHEQKKWSGDVKTQWHPKKGLFTKSAKEIASKEISGHHGSKAGAVRSLNFYINRAGTNLSPERQAELQKAKSSISARD